MSELNRVTSGLPARYEAAKEGVRILERRIDAAIAAIELSWPSDVTGKDEVIKILQGVSDDTL